MALTAKITAIIVLIYICRERSIAMQELDFKIHFVSGSQNKWADTLSRLCPNLMDLAMDYTPRVMNAPGFIVAALTTYPLASEEESEWME